MTGDDEVPSAAPFKLHVIHGKADRPAALTDAEIVQIRQMLATHAAIVDYCPIARQAAREATP